MRLIGSVVPKVKHAFDGVIVGDDGFTYDLALPVIEAAGFLPLSKWVYETVSKDSFVSIEKAKHLLGSKPKYSDQAALIRSYHTDRIEGASRSIAVGVAEANL